MKKAELAWLHTLSEKYKPLVRKYRAVIIILLAGVLLAAGGGSKKPTEAPQDDAKAPQSDYDLASFEQKLSEKLEAIEGAGRVELMLSLEQTEEAVYAVDTRQTEHTGRDRATKEALRSYRTAATGKSR